MVFEAWCARVKHGLENKVVAHVFFAGERGRRATKKAPRDGSAEVARPPGVNRSRGVPPPAQRLYCDSDWQPGCACHAQRKGDTRRHARKVEELQAQMREARIPQRRQRKTNNTQRSKNKINEEANKHPPRRRRRRTIYTLNKTRNS